MTEELQAQVDDHGAKAVEPEKSFQVESEKSLQVRVKEHVPGGLYYRRFAMKFFWCKHVTIDASLPSCSVVFYMQVHT